MIHVWQTRTGCRRSLSHVDSSCCKDNHTCWAQAALPSAFLAVEQRLAGCGAWAPTNLHTSGSGWELPWEAAPPLHHPEGWARRYHHKHCSTQFMLQRQRVRKSGVRCSPALGLLQKEIFPSRFSPSAQKTLTMLYLSQCHFLRDVSWNKSGAAASFLSVL